MKVLGIDIGTTTISSVLVDSENGSILDFKTLQSESFVEENGNMFVQDVSIILSKVLEVYSEYAHADYVGITCQMHGILYIDSNGNAISNLYTWQDESGNQLYKDGKTYTEYMSSVTGYTLASGYGLVTHFAMTNSSNTSDSPCRNAFKVCTIGDYIAMKLAHAREPIMHSTNAASLGLFDVKNHCFDIEVIKKIGIDTTLLPEVTSSYMNYPNSKISVAIGDNQASFMGSVSDGNNSLLVNIGTSGQVSYLLNEYRESETLEVRPFDNKSFLYVGATLCGGRSIALFSNFLKSVADYFSCAIPNMYDIIDLMAKNIDSSKEKLVVKNTFSGTRKNPQDRAGISNIGVENFTPENLAMGILEGISNELLEMYDKEPKSVLIASGNALRKNELLQSIVSKQFCMPLKVPEHSEEASYGAALFSMVSNQVYESIEDAQKIISLL